MSIMKPKVGNLYLVESTGMIFEIVQVDADLGVWWWWPVYESPFSRTLNSYRGKDLTKIGPCDLYNLDEFMLIYEQPE